MLAVRLLSAWEKWLSPETHEPTGVGAVLFSHQLPVYPESVTVAEVSPIALGARRRVGVELVVGDVRHPHGRTVRPDAVRIVVPCAVQGVEVQRGPAVARPRRKGGNVRGGHGRRLGPGPAAFRARMR